MKIDSISNDIGEVQHETEINDKHLLQLAQNENENKDKLQKIENDIQLMEQEKRNLEKFKVDTEETIKINKALHRQSNDEILNIDQEVQLLENRIRKKRSFRNDLNPISQNESDLANHLSQTLDENERELSLLKDKKCRLQSSLTE